MKKYFLLSYILLITSCAHYGPSVDQRNPASGENISGGKELILALKEKPNFFKAPIEYKISFENTWYFEGSKRKVQGENIYLKQESEGYFVLENNDGDMTLNYYKNDNVEQSLLSDSGLRSARKVSEDTVLLTYEMARDEDVFNCELGLDLTKFVKFHKGFSCKNQNEELILRSEIVEVVKINLHDYMETLRSIKLESHSDNMNTDEVKKDWTHLIR